MLPSNLLKPDEPVFIIGGGPSISDMLLAPLRDKPMIVINQAYKLFPEAMIHFGADKRWWQRERTEFMRTWKGNHVAACIDEGEPIDDFPDLAHIYLHSKSEKSERYHADGGLETKPTHLRGNNSGAFAINLAYHCGARLACLIGFDMKNKDGRGHWYVDKDETVDATFQNFYLPAFEGMAKDAKKHGYRIINCTPDSALQCFPTGRFEDYL